MTGADQIVTSLCVHASPDRTRGDGSRVWTDPSRAVRKVEGFLPMRNTWAALVMVLAVVTLFNGCAPVPLPHYAAYPPKRVEQLLIDSENLRQAGDDWNRFWFLDQPSHLTPYRTHGGLGF